MLIENENNIIRGNTVLKPDVTYNPNVKEKKKENKDLKSNQQRILKNRLKLIRNIAFTFVIGGVILFRYSSIYRQQGEMSKIKEEISTIKESNESMKVELIKFNNLSYIEDIATNKLKMKKPNAGNVLYTDLNSVKVPHGNVANNKAKESFVQKLKNLLF